MSEAMMWLLLRGVWETLAMTFVSGFFGFVLGLPVGVLLYVTRPGQIVANAKLYRTLSALVNIFRSIPFIILLVWMIPFTRVIVGTSIVSIHRNSIDTGKMRRSSLDPTFLLA
ncbi:methionine ABC transporter permease [Klebsiella quasipneumoniae]|uniref:D-methionine transport system permease protein MetI n=1 Tax=Klebsiella quasipneumoniae TaxID=1463165 RepID=A0ABD7NAQ4_9ENTR|nr:methionine ABC transporter permease [Klebsiella quasipneumoniae]